RPDEEPAGHACDAARRLPDGDRFRDRRGRGARARSGRGARPDALRLARPLPAWTHVGGAVLCAAARARRRDHVGERRRGRAVEPTAPARRLRLLPAGLEPTSLALHAVGMTGLTAYFGLFDVGRPRAGETVAVSGAAGAVGQIVGQLAKLSGCRTVGIAGGAEKVGYLAEYGYDVGIDHRGDDVPAALEDACPDGVDLYFDNVGGELTDLVVRRLARHARVVVCGQSSQYNLSEPELGPRQLGLLIVLRARIEGFLVSDYEQRFDEGLAQLGRWVADGTLRYREDVTAGLENAPRAFIAMLHVESRGKVLIRI